MEQYCRGRVSVIIPTYKRNDYLERAIRSVLNQTYENFEVIVVNDNVSGDVYSENISSLLDKLNDNRIIYINPHEHKNGAFARNKGLEVASGEYIAFLDDDDYWECSKLEKQINEIKQLDESFVAVACLKCYVKDGIIFRSSLPYKDGNVLKKVITRECEISMDTTLIRHSSIDSIGGFDCNLRRKQDIEFYAHLFSHGKLKLIKEHLTFIDVSNDINRKFTYEEQKKINDDFFCSIDDVLQELSENEKKYIRKICDFEAGRFLAVYDGKIVEGLKLCLPGLLSLKCIMSLSGRFIKAFIEKKLSKIIRRIY